MITLLVSVGAGGVMVGLLVGAVALIVVRLATPGPAPADSMHRRLRVVEEVVDAARHRRKAA